MASRVETARDDIASALADITVANGYRNTVANVSKAIVHPDLISAWPHVCIELGRSVIEMKNDIRNVFDELTEVFIVGFVRSDTETTTDIADTSELQDAMESLIHDLKKKICTDLLTAFVTSQTNRWNVNLSNNRLEFTRSSMLGNGRNIGIVETSFNIRVRALGPDFDDLTELLVEDGSFLVTEASDLIVAG